MLTLPLRHVTLGSCVSVDNAHSGSTIRFPLQDQLAQFCGIAHAFAEMRNNGGDTPATSKPRLIISPSLHTPVANLMSPVFPTSLLTTSSGALHTPITSCIESPIFPVPKLSPVPGPISFSHKHGLPHVPHIDLQTILRGGLSQKMIQQAAPIPVKSESMDSELNGANLDVDSESVKSEPTSPTESNSRAVLAERIRKRVDITSGLSDHEGMDGLSSSSSRKRYPSELSGHIDEKRRKFLERNRAAAQRCREKRKQWINNLQSEKFSIQEENSKLHIEVHNLRQEIMNLKRLLLQHKDCPVTKASKEGKLDHNILQPTIVFPNVSENSEIKRPSPSKPQPHHTVRLRPPRDSNNGDANGVLENLKRRITPTSSLNSDPLGPLLEGLVTKDGFSRSKFSPLFNPLSNLPRSPIIGLSPFSLGPNFGSFMSMSGSVEPQYTITSLDSRIEKARQQGKTSPSRQENPCLDVGNGLVVIREALSNCKT